MYTAYTAFETISECDSILKIVDTGREFVFSYNNQYIAQIVKVYSDINVTCVVYDTKILISENELDIIKKTFTLKTSDELKNFIVDINEFLDKYRLFYKVSEESRRKYMGENTDSNQPTKHLGEIGSKSYPTQGPKPCNIFQNNFHKLKKDVKYTIIFIKDYNTSIIYNEPIYSKIIFPSFHVQECQEYHRILNMKVYKDHQEYTQLMSRLNTLGTQDTRDTLQSLPEVPKLNGSPVNSKIKEKENQFISFLTDITRLKNVDDIKSNITPTKRKNDSNIIELVSNEPTYMVVPELKNNKDASETNETTIDSEQSKWKPPSSLWRSNSSYLNYKNHFVGKGGLDGKLSVNRPVDDIKSIITDREDANKATDDEINKIYLDFKQQTEDYINGVDLEDARKQFRNIENPAINFPVLNKFKSTTEDYTNGVDLEDARDNFATKKDTISLHVVNDPFFNWPTSNGTNDS